MAVELTSHRCRLCTANDVDAVVESVAADMWESRRDTTMGDPPWENAGHYWHNRFRELAATAVESLRG